MASKKQGEGLMEEDRQPGAVKGLTAQISDHASRLTDIGLSKAAEFADTQRQSGVQAVDEVAGIIHEFADAAGVQFGDPVAKLVHRGGDAVGAFARGLDDRSVEEMVEQGRAAIVRHPGVAIAAASAIGFVAGRIAKAGLTRASSGNEEAVA